MMGLALSPLLGTLALITAGITVAPPFFAMVPHTLIAALVLAILVWRRNPYARLPNETIEASAEGIRVGGELTPIDQIKGAYVVPDAGPVPVMVRVERRGLAPSIEIAVANVGEGRAMLRALGLDASQTVARFRTMSRALSRRRYGFAVGFGIAPLWILFGAISARNPAIAPFGIVFVLTVFFSLVAVMLWPTQLDVGADGIALTWFFRKRFIRYADVLRADIYEQSWGRSRTRGVDIILQSGEQIRVPVNQEKWSRDGRTELIAERIREAMETYRSGGAADTAMLARRGRDIGAWVRALRAIGSGANAGPRTAPIARDTLLRIATDPGAQNEDRAAAAVALSSEEEGRASLAVAARATAEPKLRIVLERAATGDEEAIAEAVAALDLDTSTRA